MRSCEISLRFHVSKITPIFLKVLLSFNLFSLFPPSIKTNHYFPPKQRCKNKFSKIQIESYVWKESAKWSKFTPLKRRKRKTPIWWPLKGSKFCGPLGSILLGGQWKVPMPGDLWNEKEKHHFHLFHFPPKQILLRFFFHLFLNYILPWF